jgi:hypothetical protein
VRQGLVKSPVKVRTASGEYLTIDFQLTPGGATNVSLQGSAHLIYRGYVALHHVGHHDGHSEGAQVLDSLHL